MADERRYSEDEIAEIFEAAATLEASNPRAASAAGGLTLPELQSIGRDVGVAPERIAEAAAALDLRGQAQPRRYDLGMPISVGRTVDLPRAPTDREWDVLVAELRRTFNAAGRDSSRGELRSWTNSKLHAYVEPTATGYQFRIGTLKGDATAVNRLGLGAILMTGVLFAVPALGGVPLEQYMDLLLIGGMGAAGLTYNAVRLPRWARRREQQMDEIVARVKTLIGSEPSRDVIGK